MTGFAWAERSQNGIAVSVEIKGLNSRYLEAQIFCPPWLSRHDAKIRRIVCEGCSRGKIEAQIRARDAGSPFALSVNEAAAAAYLKAIESIGLALGIEGSARALDLAKMPGVIQGEKAEPDADAFWAALEPTLHEAKKAFDREREREGAHTELDVLAQISRIEEALGVARGQAPALEAAVAESIRARFAELSLGVAIDESRVLAEVASYLVRHTVSEEISRLEAHLGEFRAETARNKRPGKKLDFLCQEILREINTIGSKSAVAEVSRAVVDMKEALENAREQLRNVE